MDHLTRWPEAIPLKETDTETCARALVLHCIARFSMPLDLTSEKFPVYIKVKVQNNETSGNQVAQHNCIPSTGMVDRLGGMISLTLENCPLSTTYQRQMVKCTTMGIAWYPYSPQRGPQMLLSRTGIWCPHHSNWLLHCFYSRKQRTANILHLPQLWETASKFSPTPTTSHGKFKLSMPPNQQHSDYVFIWSDARHSTLRISTKGHSTSWKGTKILQDWLWYITGLMQCLLTDSNQHTWTWTNESK